MIYGAIDGPYPYPHPHPYSVPFLTNLALAQGVSHAEGEAEADGGT
jgi:hypothetical protein